MLAGTVGGLWRYPVKSMRGEECAVLALTDRGAAGDRAYALLDQASGKVASAKHPRLWGSLLACRAAFVESPGAEGPQVCITLADGRSLIRGDEAIDDALSRTLGRAVALIGEPPEGAEIERYWPDVAGLARRDAITAGPIGGGGPPGTFVDYAPVHLLTTAALDYLRALHPAGRADARRFRPNVLIATNASQTGFVENDWVGRTLAIGEAVRLRVTDPTPRCVVPTLAQADLPRDLGILRTVVAHNRPPIPALGGATQPSLGAYAVVERAGVIRRGDAVRLLA